MEVMRHVLLECVCARVGWGWGGCCSAWPERVVKGKVTHLECPVLQEHMGQAPLRLWTQEVPWPNSVQTGEREGFSLNTHKTSPPECLWAQVPAVSL